MVRIKICGNTSVQDALRCAELGADAVSVIVEVPVDTPRNVSMAEAREIISSLPVFVDGVAVVMPANVEEALRFYEEIRPEAIQLHGGESPEFVGELREALPCRLIKTISVEDESSLERAMEFSRICDALLLDTPSPQLGGSGLTHNWELSKRIVEESEVPVILAGGLNPENVGEAVKFVKPYAVDVVSGVEKEEERGRKDYSKVEKFIEEARRPRP